MIRPFVAFFAAAGLLAAAPAVRAQEDAKAVLEKAVAAHGGQEFLAKNKATRLSTRGKLTIPGVGEVEFTQQIAMMLPDKLKESLDFSVMGQAVSVLTLIDGDKMTLEANGKAIDLSDQIKKALSDARHLMKAGRLYPLLQDKGYKLSLIGEVMVEGKPTIGVLVSCDGQKDISLFFDRETHLLSKLEHRTVNPTSGDEITEERIILEYVKDKSGVQRPKKVVVKHDGKAFLEAEVIEVEYLESIDASEFRK